MCAIVNDSIAPNAYMLPRNVGLAGDHGQAGDRAEHDDPDPRRAEAAGAAGAAGRASGGGCPSSRRAATRR